MSERRFIAGVLTVLLTFSALVWGCLSPDREQLALSGPRSACWRVARAEYIARHPQCEACGEKAEEVHHEVPFSTDPRLECEQSNLLALCRQHHFELGHCRNYQFHNPNVRRDVARYREMIAGRKPNKPKGG